MILLLPASVSANSIGTMNYDINISPVTNGINYGVSKIVSSLRDSILTPQATDLDVIIEMTGDKANLKHNLFSFGGQVTHDYQFGSLMAATIPSDRLLELARTQEVVKIYKNEKISLGEEWAMKGEATTSEINMDDFVASSSFDLSTLPDTYANAYLTNANQVWAMTNAGAGQVIAVIDTGVLPHFLLGSRLIGGVDLTPDVGTPFEGYDNPYNFYHGTFVSTQAAANGRVLFYANSSVGQAFLKFDPNAMLRADGLVQVDLLGPAPLASIYAIKVFTASSFTTTAIILAGIEHAILQNVDVINLSLGGPSNIPGEDPMDILVDVASSRGIAVTISAGNSGPNPLQIGSPGTSISAITVGAASTPEQERVYGEFRYGVGDYYYSHDEKSIVYFSSRGPTADGRAKPDLVATGSHNLGGIGYTGLSFGSGTSYSSPVVAGGAALISAYSDLNGLSLTSQDIKEALSAGADLIPGFNQIEQGHGYMNLQNSIAFLQSSEQEFEHEDHGIDRGEIEENLEEYMTITELQNGYNMVKNINVAPSQFEYFAFSVPTSTDFIKISLVNASFTSDNPIFGDRGWAYLSTAMYNGIRGNYYAVDVVLGGDSQLFALSDFDFQAGVLRFTIENDFISFGNLHIDAVIFEVVDASLESEHGSLEIENDGIGTMAFVDVFSGGISAMSGHIMQGDVLLYSVSLPSTNFGISIFELSWERDYRYYGTDDLDMYIFNSTGYLVGIGASLSAPEISLILSSGGVFTVMIVGYDIYDPSGTEFNLEVTTLDFGAPLLYSSPMFYLGPDSETEIMVPGNVHGVAALTVIQEISFFGYTFPIWVFADFAQV